MCEYDKNTHNICYKHDMTFELKLKNISPADRETFSTY